VPLYKDLRRALESAGRLEWLYEETQELERAEIHRTEPELAWRRLKGIDRLQPRQRATIKLLARWREEMAVRSDKPRGWILPDEALREIAERLPESAADLEQIRSLQPGVVRRRAAEILSLVEQARDAAAGEAAAVSPQRPDPQSVARVTQLLNFARTQAEQLKISPELLATRRDVEQLVFSARAEHLLTGWRREVIGERLVEMAGRRA
jgi:ribonuclease D